MSEVDNTGGGIAGLKFLDDILFLLSDRWVPARGGKKPKLTKEWETKIVGHVNKNYANIIASLDSENPQIFSLLQGDATNWENFNYDWLHEVSITLDIRTGESQRRVDQLVNETVSIIKSRIVPIIDNTQYVQLSLEGITSMNEEYRNIFRYLVSVSCLRVNP